jgi:hypothetical protein
MTLAGLKQQICFGMMKEGLDLFKGFTQSDNERQLTRIKAFAQKSNVLRRNPEKEADSKLKENMANISMHVAVYNYFIENTARLCVDLAGPEAEKKTPVLKPRKIVPGGIRNIAPTMNNSNHESAVDK